MVQSNTTGTRDRARSRSLANCVSCQPLQTRHFRSAAVLQRTTTGDNGLLRERRVQSNIMQSSAAGEGQGRKGSWQTQAPGPSTLFPKRWRGRGLSSRQLGMRTCRRTALIMDNNACDTKAERCLMNKCGCMNGRIQIGANDSHLGTRAVNNPRQRPRKIGRWLDSPAHVSVIGHAGCRHD